MNSIKKRKHAANKISDDNQSSDNEEAEVVISLKQKKNKKLRRIVVSSDEESDQDTKMDDDEITSITQIKKNAKARAKKLAAQGDSADLQSSTQKKTNKTTPPPSKPANSIMNYFRPTNANKKVIEPEPKRETAVVKPESEDDDDGFKVTVLNDDIVKKEIAPKKKEKNETIAKKEKIKKADDVMVKKEKSSPIKDGEMVFVKKSTTKKENVPKRDVTPEKKVDVIKKKVGTPKRKEIPVQKDYPPVEHPKPEPQRISELFVDKYRPTVCKNVVGQQGAASPMNKLINWLRNWYSELDSKGSFRAALLSGPPGIGKTTTAQLVCQELGYDYLELNASDARNKKSLQENLNQLLGNTKLTNFFKPVTSDDADCSQKLTSKHCVIMDEVDGMSGNEDRGGTAELILLIKKTKVPIICICNDRNHEKIRSLANHCLDLRFPKPRVEQIKAALMSIAFKESIKISPDVLEELIVSSNHDIRQCIHNLSMLGASQAPVRSMINSDQKPIKDIKLGPFEAIKKVFAVGEDYARMSLNDKSDLFFCDYSIMPLFVYENYLNINLSGKDICTQLKQALKAINSISYGELIDREVHANQSWSMLPMEAIFASVMPGAYMRSTNGLGFPQFPQYLGKISTLNKSRRLVDELMGHAAISITGSRSAFSLDYIEPMRDTLMRPLLVDGKEGIPKVLEKMEDYSLIREDMTTIFELALWKDDEDPFKKVDTKTKTALTKECKRGFALPYAT